MLILRLSSWCLVLLGIPLGPAVVGAEPFAYITNFSEAGTVYYRGAACSLAPCVRTLETTPGATGVASVLRATVGCRSFGDWSATLAP